LGHKRILRDKTVVDFITAYIFNGQLRRDEELMKNINLFQRREIR